MKSITATITIACLLSLTPVKADSEGNYPGKGSYSDWQQAADASEDGVIYAKKGNYTMAVRCYDEAIQQYPFDASFYYNKGVAFNKTNRAREAVALFKKAIDLEPNFASAWYDLANSQKQIEDLPTAEASYKQALKLAPKHMKAWFNLGETCFSQKKYADAKDAFTHAQELAATEQDKKDIAEYQQETSRILQKASTPAQTVPAK